MDKKKHVNPHWAAKLIAEVPATSTKSRVVWCDGGNPQTGHPRVYINLVGVGILCYFSAILRFFSGQTWRSLLRLLRFEVREGQSSLIILQNKIGE